MTKRKVLSKTEALLLIVANEENPTIEYAVDYAKIALLMNQNTEMFRVQLLYVVSNLHHWRQNRNYVISQEQISDIKIALKRNEDVPLVCTGYTSDLKKEIETNRVNRLKKGTIT